MTHKGYNDYRDICYQLAPQVGAAVMAAAVLNWLPKTPFPGKMPSDVEEGTEQQITFVLAERVINKMRELNPYITLIGCKLLFGNDLAKLIEASYHVILQSRCNAVVANDARIGLKRKYVIHQDRSIKKFRDDFVGLYEHLDAMFDDKHYRTKIDKTPSSVSAPRALPDWESANELFDLLTVKYRKAFVQRHEGSDFVLGAVAVPVGDVFLVSPREKGHKFSSKNAAVVKGFDSGHRVVYTIQNKASLNAPLLVRHLQAYPQAAAVVHVHDDDPGAISVIEPSDKMVRLGLHAKAYTAVEHAPPGTVRDNDRDIPSPTYYIKGHGWIVAVDKRGVPLG